MKSKINWKDNKVLVIKYIVITFIISSIIFLTVINCKKQSAVETFNNGEEIVCTINDNSFLVSKQRGWSLHTLKDSAIKKDKIIFFDFCTIKN